MRYLKTFEVAYRAWQLLKLQGDQDQDAQVLEACCSGTNKVCVWRLNLECTPKRPQISQFEQCFSFFFSCLIFILEADVMNPIRDGFLTTFASCHGLSKVVDEVVDLTSQDLPI